LTGLTQAKALCLVQGRTARGNRLTDKVLDPDIIIFSKHRITIMRTPMALEAPVPGTCAEQLRKS